MAASHQGDCNKYDLSLPPYFSTLGASLLQPCQGSRAAGTPKSGAWNGNQCPHCRTAANKIGRKQKREQKKQKAEMDNNSILFPDQKMLADYKPSKGRGIIQLSPAASVGIPGLAGAVEIPEAY